MRWDKIIVKATRDIYKGTGMKNMGIRMMSKDTVMNCKDNSMNCMDTVMMCMGTMMNCKGKEMNCMDKELKCMDTEMNCMGTSVSIYKDIGMGLIMDTTSYYCNNLSISNKDSCMLILSNPIQHSGQPFYSFLIGIRLIIIKFEQFFLISFSLHPFIIILIFNLSFRHSISFQILIILVFLLSFILFSFDLKRTALQFLSFFFIDLILVFSLILQLFFCFAWRFRHSRPLIGNLSQLIFFSVQLFLSKGR